MLLNPVGDLLWRTYQDQVSTPCNIGEALPDIARRQRLPAPIWSLPFRISAEVARWSGAWGKSYFQPRIRRFARMPKGAFARTGRVGR